MSAAAHRHCRAVTRAQARNFSYGIRLLPPERRRAMEAVYALARRIDDVGDGEWPEQRKLDALRGIRDDVEVLAAGGSVRGDDPVMVALADAAARLPLPLGAFSDLIDGVEMDVRGTSYGTFADLEVYCRRVAGSIGRLCVGVFGVTEPRAHEHADDLGVALQLTNILRDVDEDAARGRVYLPAEDLDGRDLAAVVHLEAARARDWYDRGWRLLPYLDRRSAACVTAMAGIYRRLLERIDADPAAIRRGRVSLPAWQKATVAAASLVAAGGLR